MASQEKNPLMNNECDSQSETTRKFPTAFAWGVAGWLIGVLILFALSWPIARPETVSIAAIWAISYGWAAYLFGLVAVVLCGLRPRIPLRQSLIAYRVPAIVLLLLAVICLLVYPDAVLREDLLLFLPVTWVFYLFGLLWTIFTRNGSAETSGSLRLLVPAMVGGLAIFGSVSIPAFVSDAFRYRNAFVFTLDKRTVDSEFMTAEGAMEIRKPGDYLFSAPRYLFEEISEDDAGYPRTKDGEITWGAGGKPNAGSIGTFPLKIVWPRSSSSASPLEPGYEDQVIVEIRDRSRGDRLIHSISAGTDP